jgi:FAD/FMN-containing dehydrogenase
MDRRAFLALAASATVTGCLRDSGAVELHDVARLDDLDVARALRPRRTEDVVRALASWPGPVSIGGARFSMGGQIAAPGSLHLDMRAMNRLVALDPAARTARVQAGMTWRDLLDALQPHGLAVAIMQSFSNFSIGGSVSVNCHGRYVGKGPVVNSVRALQLVLADGRVVECDRAREPELFAAAIGGYGGLGVITEVELDLARNARIRRQVEPVALADYPHWFRERVLADSAMVLHNADLTPPAFDAPLATSWRRTDEPVTVAEPLVPRGVDYAEEQRKIWAVSELPGGASLRQRAQAQMAAEQMVVWRNHEASLDTASLEPVTRRWSTYLLQEYFVPVAAFVPFARAMAAILARHDVNALNVSIRHSPADTTTLMHWAPREVFCFVLYHKQRVLGFGEAQARTWTRELIDAALAHGGRYYLPYRRHATRAQFRRAYPEVDRFAALKRTWDPQGRFRNALWNTYLG